MAETATISFKKAKVVTIYRNRPRAEICVFASNWAVGDFYAILSVKTLKNVLTKREVYEQKEIRKINP